YVLLNKGLKVKKNASLVSGGKGVTFFLTASNLEEAKDLNPLKVESNDKPTDVSRVKLSAPTDQNDPYRGILMFQDMRVQGEKKSSPGDWGGKIELKKEKGNVGQTLELNGLIHAPSISLEIGDGGEFISDRLLFVVRKVKIGKNAEMKLNPTTLPDGTPFRRVTLIR
ncbi:MAG: hypothetical protein RIS35_2632, partial [Pseudomonadota bacterium]